MFPLISYSEVAKYIPIADELGVSKIARGANGFVSILKHYGKDNIPENWLHKRENFIKRHLVQYKKNPTKRRQIALLMWAYKV